MVDVEFIKKKHGSEGWPIRKIARQLEVSRQTVRKVLASSAEPPRYQQNVPRPRPVMGPYLPVIERWLKADETAPRKQRHTAKRVHDRLVEEYDFRGSQVTVRRAVRALRGRRVEMFVPLEAVPGKVAQADFGQAQVLVAGTMQKVFIFCLRAKHSKVPFAVAYPTEKLEAFLDGHTKGLEFFGGVFSEIWYDNPKTAVSKILVGPDRIEHEHFSRLRAHYLFDSSFCTPGEAHEKGSVENLVGYVRRNALVPASKPFASLEAVNAHLRAFCERERVRNAAAWALEETALGSLPIHPFRAATSRPVSVSKTALVCIDHNRYSVPAVHSGRLLRAEVYADKVEIYADAVLVASHPRSYLRGESFLELSHYLPAFERKPRAAAACAALHQADPVFMRARDLLLREPGGYRVFAQILMLGMRFDLGVLAEALRECLASGRLSVEAVHQRCLNLTHTTPERAAVPELLATRLPRPDLTRYDALLVGAR
jgi:transposase